MSTRVHGPALIGRALLVWLLLMAVESVHGTLRTLLLVPVMGDEASRRLGVLTGSVLVLLVTIATIRWMRAGGTARLLGIGILWALLTVAFEIALGRLILQLDWARILSDHDLRRGGLMPFGLLVMMLAPWIAARIRMGPGKSIGNGIWRNGNIMAGRSSDTQRTLLRQLAGLAGWLVACFVAGAAGAIASADAGTFYAQLARPAWAPPGWLFAPVWTALYALMAVSAWQIWRVHGFGAGRKALLLFVAQLALNTLWTWIFFAWQDGAMAFGEILLLWCFIAATIAAFWRLQAFAAALLLPYLAWVTFATFLTYATWQLNPELL